MGCRFNNELLLGGGEGGNLNLPFLMGGLSPILDVEDEMEITPGKNSKLQSLYAYLPISSGYAYDQ